jgi:NAD+ kinase
MRLALVLHPTRESSATVGSTLAAAAAERGITVVAAPDDAARMPGVTRWDASGSVEVGDVIVAVGGDGTVLAASHLSRTHDVPLLGVNAGNVGFLAEVEPAQIPEALDRLVAGRFRISTRMTLEATLPRGRVVPGLNDVVVEKAVSRQVVGIAVSVAGEGLVEYRTDAVIVATPTGSTAYTFSAGGPLVDPEIEALILTAVAPHNLFGRPIVFGPTVALEISITSDRPARVNIDGHHHADLSPGDTITVVRGSRPVRLLRFNPSNFARTVKEKFHLHDA